MKVTMRLIVIDILGTIPKIMVKETGRVGFKRTNKNHPNMALKRSTRILRRVLDI